MKIADEGTWVHPPLGKWIIALLGVGPMGLQRRSGGGSPRRCSGSPGWRSSTSWRSSSVAIGLVGGLPRLLLALDGLHIVQSRIAMLDIFLRRSSPPGCCFLVLDRARMDPRRLEPAGGADRTRSSARPTGSAPGRVLGRGGRDEVVGRVRAGLRGRPLRDLVAHAATGDGAAQLRRTAGTLVASFVLVPLAGLPAQLRRVLLPARLRGPRLPDAAAGACSSTSGHLRGPAGELRRRGPGRCCCIPSSTTPRCATGRPASIVALGNPVLWWGFLRLLPRRAACRSSAGRSWQDALVFGGYAAMFLPWFAVATDPVHLVHAAGRSVHVPGCRSSALRGAAGARGAEHGPGVRRSGRGRRGGLLPGVDRPARGGVLVRTTPPPAALAALRSKDGRSGTAFLSDHCRRWLRPARRSVGLTQAPADAACAVRVPTAGVIGDVEADAGRGLPGGRPLARGDGVDADRGGAGRRRARDEDQRGLNGLQRGARGAHVAAVVRVDRLRGHEGVAKVGLRRAVLGPGAGAQERRQGDGDQDADDQIRPPSAR